MSFDPIYTEQVDLLLDVLPVINGDAFGGLLDHPTGQIVTDTARGNDVIYPVRPPSC